MVVITAGCTRFISKDLVPGIIFTILGISQGDGAGTFGIGGWCGQSERRKTFAICDLFGRAMVPLSVVAAARTPATALQWHQRPDPLHDWTFLLAAQWLDAEWSALQYRYTTWWLRLRMVFRNCHHRRHYRYHRHRINLRRHHRHTRLTPVSQMGWRRGRLDWVIFPLPW